MLMYSLCETKKVSSEKGWVSAAGLRCAEPNEQQINHGTRGAEPASVRAAVTTRTDKREAADLQSEEGQLISGGRRPRPG